MKSSRERLLITLLPAFIVLGLYGWTMSRAVHEQLGQERERLETAEKSFVSGTEIHRQRTELKEKEKRVGELEEYVGELREQLPSFETANGQAKRVRAVSAVLVSNGLTIIKEESRETATGRLPGRLREIAAPPPPDSISSSSRRRRSTAIRETNRTIQLWEIVFTGPYINVERALDQLEQDVPSAVPVSLEMEQTEFNASARQWRMVIWL